MANTITNVQIIRGKRRVIQYLTLVSDGTNETGRVVFDCAATSTALGLPNTATSDILKIVAIPNVAATARLGLYWDATTPILATSLALTTITKYHPEPCCGGLPNQGGAGVTGNITLTTTGLAAGDSLTIVLDVRMK